MEIMKLGISELAWPGTNNFDVILNLLNINNITCIELVIPKHSPWVPINMKPLQTLRHTINQSNINVLSTQSVLFNSNVKLIGDIYFVSHMERLIDICITLGIKKIILGSPKQRTGFTNIHLGNIFRILDEKIGNHDITILLEPNSQQYGGEYFFTLDEIIKFLDQYNFKNIKTMIDMHNIILEKQNPSDEFIKYQSYIDHVHISETNLSSFKESNVHYQLADTLHKCQYTGLVVYECNQSPTLFDDILLFTNIYNKVI
jgi:sugar phosphate isomerase/epimerase